MDKYTIDIVSNEESPLFYSAGQERDKETGCIGHMRLDFGRNGNEFWHTWEDHCPGLNTRIFKDEFENVINTLRKDLLTNFFSATSYCYNHPQAKLGDGRGYNYGFKVKTNNYIYYLRLSSLKNDYSYCYAYERNRLEKALLPEIENTLESKLENAARYIIEKSAKETTSGNYITYTGNVPEDIISPELFSKHIQDIVDIMQEYEAVLDIIVEDGSINVVMGLAYCPNYEPWEEEKDEYPDDREILDPLQSRRTLEPGKERLKAAEQKYGKDSFEYEYIKNEVSLSLEKYTEVLGNVESELNNRGYMLKNGEYTVQDYLNDYIDNVDVSPLPSDNKKIADYIINRETRDFSRSVGKPSLMDKVEKGKQKAARQEQPDKANNKKQEALE